MPAHFGLTPSRYQSGEIDRDRGILKCGDAGIRCNCLAPGLTMSAHVQANAAWAVSDRWTVSGALGRQSVSSDFDYTTWNVGAAVKLNDTLALDLRYHDTDEHGFGEIYGSRAVASLKASF